MFNEIGKKIKLIAEIIAVLMPCITIAAVGSAIAGGSSPWAFIFAGVFCTLMAWPLYGFGQLVQDVHNISLGSMQINSDEELPNL